MNDPQWVKRAARMIAVRIMNERSGSKDRMTLSQWEEFIEKCILNPPYGA